MRFRDNSLHDDCKKRQEGFASSDQAVQAQLDERGQRRRPVRHRRSMILAIPALLGVIYCAWSLHRTSFSILTGDPQWPRPGPYPDQWLVELNDWYDNRNLPPSDSIKLHGEWDRVRVTVALVLASCLWVLVIRVVKVGIPGCLQKRRCLVSIGKK
jgi:hypothetical protein